MIKDILSPDYTHIYFCNLTGFQLNAKLGPIYMHFISVALLLISDSPPEKESSHLAEVFLYYLEGKGDLVSKRY